MLLPWRHRPGRVLHAMDTAKIDPRNSTLFCDLCRSIGHHWRKHNWLSSARFALLRHATKNGLRSGWRETLVFFRLQQHRLTVGTNDSVIVSRIRGRRTVFNVEFPQLRQELGQQLLEG